jgi:acyl-CoA thioesterase I
MNFLKIIIIFSFLSSFNAWSKTILFLGDSLTEGYQLSREEAYPYLVEQHLKTKHPEIKVINGGVSGATTASGLKRLNWYLKSKPDYMVLALGANDGLRGTKLEESKKNLIQVIERAQKENIKVILAGMKMPTNYGESYRDNFEKMFNELAKKYDLPLIPFLLEGVGGVAKLNLPDGIHPNQAGHKVMAQTVLKVLEPLL